MPATLSQQVNDFLSPLLSVDSELLAGYLYKEDIQTNSVKQALLAIRSHIEILQLNCESRVYLRKLLPDCCYRKKSLRYMSKEVTRFLAAHSEAAADLTRLVLQAGIRHYAKPDNIPNELLRFRNYSSIHINTARHDGFLSLAMVESLDCCNWVFQISVANKDIAAAYNAIAGLLLKYFYCDFYVVDNQLIEPGVENCNQFTLLLNYKNPQTPIILPQFIDMLFNKMDRLLMAAGINVGILHPACESLRYRYFSIRETSVLALHNLPKSSDEIFHVSEELIAFNFFNLANPYQTLLRATKPVIALSTVVEFVANYLQEKIIKKYSFTNMHADLFFKIVAKATPLIDMVILKYLARFLQDPFVIKQSPLLVDIVGLMRSRLREKQRALLAVLKCYFLTLKPLFSEAHVSVTSLQGVPTILSLCLADEFPEPIRPVMLEVQNFMALLTSFDGAADIESDSAMKMMELDELDESLLSSADKVALAQLLVVNSNYKKREFLSSVLIPHWRQYKTQYQAQPYLLLLLLNRLEKRYEVYEEKHVMLLLAELYLIMLDIYDLSEELAEFDFIRLSRIPVSREEIEIRLVKHLKKAKIIQNVITDCADFAYLEDSQEVKLLKLLLKYHQVKKTDVENILALYNAIPDEERSSYFTANSVSPLRAWAFLGGRATKLPIQVQLEREKAKLTTGIRGEVSHFGKPWRKVQKLKRLRSAWSCP